MSRVTRTLLRHGLDVSLKDNDGNTSLTFLARLLDKQLYTEGFELATILLQDVRCNANSTNSQGRSLLSFSVTHGDASADLTRKLLNHGAQVLPYRAGSGSDATSVLRERESSAFSWFLRSAMRHRDLSICHVTLKLHWPFSLNSCVHMFWVQCCTWVRSRVGQHHPAWRHCLWNWNCSWHHIGDNHCHFDTCALIAFAELLDQRTLAAELCNLNYLPPCWNTFTYIKNSKFLPNLFWYPILFTLLKPSQWWKHIYKKPL